MEDDTAPRRDTRPNGSLSHADNFIQNTITDIFANNEARVIDNPFAPAHMTPKQAREAGRSFAENHGLGTKVQLFENAGSALHDPAGYKSLRRLDDDEKAALASETRPERHILHSLRNMGRPGGLRALASDLFPRNGFWRQPKTLRATVVMLCIASVVQGWCQASTNGANLNWAYQILGPTPGLQNDQECDLTGQRAWIFALVNAAPFLSGAIIGCWLSDPLGELLLGRRAPIAISAVAIIAASIASGFVEHWGTLLLCRIIVGLGMGTKAAVVPVYTAEIAPSHLRGSLVMNWQLFDALGIFLGFTANLIAARVGAAAWRWQFASAALPALILLGQLYAAPESPRFLMKRGKYVAAYETFLTLRREPILAAKELLYAYEQMKLEIKLLSLPKAAQDPEKAIPPNMVGRLVRNNPFAKAYLIFSKKRMRRALLAAVVVMLAQQLCGINVLIFYSSTLFGDVGHDCGQADRIQLDTRPLFLTWGVGLTNFVFTIPAYWLIDSRGRRWLLIVTLPLMALCMLAASLSFLSGDNNPAYAPVVGLFAYVFVALYSVGVGPVPFTYSAECFPLEVRMVGMSLSVFVNFLWAGLVGLFVPVATESLRHTGLLGLFAGLNVVAFILIFLFLPETGGAAIANDPAKADNRLTAMSLEELNYIFGCDTRDHVKYQFKEVLRDYFLERYIYMKKDTPRPEKFYKWPYLQQQRRATLDKTEAEAEVDQVEAIGEERGGRSPTRSQ